MLSDYFWVSHKDSNDFTQSAYSFKYIILKNSCELILDWGNQGHYIQWVYP